MGFCFEFISETKKMMNPTVSIFAEIPETLHDSLKTYLETHPEWDLDRVFCASLSLFLLQNADSGTPEASRSYRQAARVYLETLFQTPHDLLSQQ
jgi:hypothetical protein